MAVSVAQDQQFTFVAGLNTEASYFTFPKNTWKDGVNVVPNINGTLSKRVALDLEADYITTNRNITSSERNLWAFVNDKWTAVAGNGDINFLVVQCGRYVYFYNDTSIATSATVKAYTIDLNSYKAASNPSVIGTNPIKAVSANGSLIITSIDTDPILVEYDIATAAFSASKITINIRDFEGVDDGLAIDERPATLSDLHKYNLYNQGWLDARISTYVASGDKLYPSNTQSWIYGKDSADLFKRDILDKQDFGTSPAPKGRYLLNAFYEDRSAVSGIAGLPAVIENYRPAVCAFFAGRAWYAGVQSSRIGANVYFSQVATTSDKYGKCYQDADPSSEVLSDLIDSDGGVVPIQECGQIIDIISMENGILVLATNGVWHVMGTSQSGFSATGYEVRRISTMGCMGRHSVVVADDNILFFSYTAICRIAVDEKGFLLVTAITDLNIKSFYNSIPPLARKYAAGSYNGSSGVIYWLYDPSMTTDTSTFPYKKTHAIVLDVRLQAFYKLEFGSASNLPYVVDIVTTREVADTEIEYEVISNDGSNVVNSGGVQVGADLIVSTASFKQFKMLTVIPDGSYYELTFADFLTEAVAPSKWYDWYSYNNTGVSYDCYLITGYSFAPNGPDKKKQAIYITTFMERTETGFDVDYNPINESSCLMSARWDFTDHINANKWATSQQIYRHKRPYIPDTSDFNTGYPIVITKNKLRGRGLALQLKFEAEADYDMRLFGWSVIMYGGSNV